VVKELTLDIENLNVKLVLVIAFLVSVSITSWKAGSFFTGIEQSLDAQKRTHDTDINSINQKLDTIIVKMSVIPQAQQNIQSLSDDSAVIRNELAELKRNLWSKEDQQRFCETAELKNDNFSCGPIH